VQTHQVFPGVHHYYPPILDTQVSIMYLCHNQSYIKKILNLTNFILRNWKKKALMIFFKMLVWCFASLDSLEFITTDLELYRPVISGETVRIDCTTDKKAVTINLLRKNKNSKSPTLLRVRLMFYIVLCYWTLSLHPNLYVYKIL